MKKKIIIIVLVLIIVFGTFASIGMFTTSFIEYSVLGAKIYRGDRITAELHIYVDDKAATITKEDDGNYEIKQTEYGAVLSHRANENDTYEYNLLVDGKYKMKITAKHLNWWEVTTSTVYVHITTETDSCFISEKYEYTSDNPKYRIKNGENNENRYEVSNGFDFSIGPKE